MSRIHEFAALSEKKAALRAQLSELESDLAALMPLVLDDMADAGVKNMKLDNGQMVYIRRDVWAKAKDGNKLAVVDALRASGLEEMVSFSTRTLTAYVRRAEESDDEIPQALRDTIEISEEFKACVKGA